MSAIPLRQEAEAPKTGKNSQPCILELHATDFALNPYTDRLISQGYEVVQAHNYEEALRAAHECYPALIVVHDDPAANIDAVRWLESQHTDRVWQLALTPLLILADAMRARELRIHELPDRVIVLQRRSDTLNQLARTASRVLRLAAFE
jgi:DNA-binding response OmpR family regulator